MASLSLLVLAAGMGSRYGGLKQVDPMGPGGETLLDYSVYDALKAGCDKVVFLIRKDIEADFRAKVGRRYEGRIPVEYSFQQLDALPGGYTPPEGRTKPWGTAHAIWCARGEIAEPFIAINADDYYGAKSYVLMADYLRKVDAAGTDFAMAGYRLDKTLSEYGSVSRGVCATDGEGRLTDIVECTGIRKDEAGIFQDGAGGERISFHGDEPVSMNFWGLTPAVFPALEGFLLEFLAAQGGELKSESYIPTALGEMVKSGGAALRVLPTDAPWFGVTYQEDKPRVQAALQALHEAGAYPASLWR